MPNIYELLRRNQDGTASYVKDFLDSLELKYEVDSYGNIFYLDNEKVPLLSAHMDTVRKDADICIGAFLTESEDEKIFSGGILGGDDKCGVYMILRALKEGHKVNFIFSRDEEIGCVGIKNLLKPTFSAENKELTDKIKNNCLYCLVLDRRGKGDIICKNNFYGTKEFEEALKKVSDDGNFGYAPATGACSDANTIREFVSTANLSVGYYAPHSKNEYIVKKDLENAYNYMVAIIQNLKEAFEPYKYEYTGYSGYAGGYYGGYYGYSGRYGAYTSEASKHYKGKSKGNTYYNRYYDYDDYDYSDYSYDQWKNYDASKSKCSCAFCGESDDTEKLVGFVMPDGEEFKICAFCLEEIEDEVKRVKPLLSKI